MSKRVILWSLFAVVLVAALILSNFGRNLPTYFFSDPVFSEKIPDSRPRRLDHRLMDRFATVPVPQILVTLEAEKKEREAELGTVEEPTEKTPESKLLASLPDAPVPFADHLSPRDETWLRDFVSNFQQSSSTSPNAKDLRLFNLALSALSIDPGQLPESLRPGAPLSPESDTLQVKWQPREINSRGAFCMADFNGDGHLEKISEGGLTIVKVGLPEVSLAAPLQQFPGNGLYPSDYDRDGDLDLFVTRGTGLPNSLLRNRGNGQFDDVTTETGLLSFNDSAVAGWLDFDLDGYLDLMVGSVDHPLELFRQTQLGTFQPVAWDLNLWIPRGTIHLEIADFSRDGFPDFFLGVQGLPDRLYLNQPASNWSDWRFINMAPEAGLPVSREPSPGHFFDFDNDGAVDLVTGIAASGGSADPGSPPPAGIQIYHNDGEGLFQHLTDELGIKVVDGVSALDSVDLDNDGYEELLVGTKPLFPNRVFWNRGGTAFRDISVASRASFLDEPARMEAEDIDGDGRADWIYRSADGTIRWLSSHGPAQNFVRVVLTRSSPGKLIRITTRDSDWIVDTISHQLGDQTEITLGIGDARKIERVELLTFGSSQALVVIEEVEPNQKVVIDPAPAL